jgi:putative flippase GtrA
LVWRVGRFLCVGLVGLGVDAGLFSLLYGQGSGAPVARAASLAVATLVTWSLNRAFTFGPSHRRAFVEALRYAGVALLAQGFNYLTFLGLLHVTGAAHPLRTLVATAVMTAAFSFMGQSLFAFGRAQPLDPLPQR